MAMKVEMRDNKLFIEIDLEKPTPSASGKTLVVGARPVQGKDPVRPHHP